MGRRRRWAVAALAAAIVVGPPGPIGASPAAPLLTDFEDDGWGSGHVPAAALSTPRLDLLAGDIRYDDATDRFSFSLHVAVLDGGGPIPPSPYGADDDTSWHLAFQHQGFDYEFAGFRIRQLALDGTPMMREVACVGYEVVNGDVWPDGVEMYYDCGRGTVDHATDSITMDISRPELNEIIGTYYGDDVERPPFEIGDSFTGLQMFSKDGGWWVDRTLPTLRSFTIE